MDPVSTTLRWPFIEVRFVTPFGNGLTVDAYKLMIYSHVTNTYVEDTFICDGSTFEVMSLMGCDIPMNDFLTTFGYLRGVYPLFQASAHNDDGWSTSSPPNSSGVTV
jgi:hypothetical protein